MRRLTLLLALGSTAAVAQVSGPIVTQPAFVGLSEPLAVMGQRGNATAFEVRGFRVSRSHDIDKSRTVQDARTDITPNVTVAANTPYNQTATYLPLTAPIGVNFEALGVGTPSFSISGAPPDTTLAVSPTQIVQWVNSQLAVYNKAGVALLAAPGFVNGNTIWSALGVNSLCASTNRGDPIVQYDRINQRWVLSQFAFTGNGTVAPYSQCIAVSQTSNALGAYNLYEYSFGNALPDYGKLGLWTDAYYITYNMFTNGATFSGGRACAYDKAAMLAGAAATQICFNSTAHFSFLPSDLDGPTLPPAGTPNFHITWNWPFTATAPYTMQMIKFVPNFVTPASSTFTDGFGGAAFSSVNFTMDAGTLASCADNGNNCVPQLGTANLLDTLGSRHMYRLVYRNFGTYDALLITQSVDPVGGQVAAVRWWEIRRPNANPPVVYQNSTFAPAGTENRWMSSAAFDKLGNIGIGYSASSSTMDPAIKVTGRLRNDPKNLLRTEALVQAGGGSQTGTLNRWGDYSTMQIDPADECTFWYTTQYIGINGTFNWRTRVASFKFPNCQ